MQSRNKTRRNEKVKFHGFLKNKLFDRTIQLWLGPTHKQYNEKLECTLETRVPHKTNTENIINDVCRKLR